MPIQKTPLSENRERKNCARKRPQKERAGAGVFASGSRGLPREGILLPGKRLNHETKITCAPPAHLLLIDADSIAPARRAVKGWSSVDFPAPLRPHSSSFSPARTVRRTSRASSRPSGLCSAGRERPAESAPLQKRNMPNNRNIFRSKTFVKLLTDGFSRW